MNNRPFSSVEYSLEKCRDGVSGSKQNVETTKKRERIKENERERERGGLSAERNAGVLHSIKKSKNM